MERLLFSFDYKTYGRVKISVCPCGDLAKQLSCVCADLTKASRKDAFEMRESWTFSWEWKLERSQEITKRAPENTISDAHIFKLHIRELWSWLRSFCCELPYTQPCVRHLVSGNSSPHWPIFHDCYLYHAGPCFLFAFSHDSHNSENEVICCSLPYLCDESRVKYIFLYCRLTVLTQLIYRSLIIFL